MSPWFLVIFFGIFHAFGGAMFGRGVRALWTEPDKALGFVIGGALFGFVPLMFDWFYFIQQHQVVQGVVGPALFVGTALLSALAGRGILKRIDPKALMVTGIGVAAALLGVLAIPFLLEPGEGRDIGSMEYVMGGCWVFMFIVIGSGFALSGLNALLHERTFDQQVALSQPHTRSARHPRNGKLHGTDGKDENDESLPGVR